MDDQLLQQCLSVFAQFAVESYKATINNLTKVWQMRGLRSLVQTSEYPLRIQNILKTSSGAITQQELFYTPSGYFKLETHDEHNELIRRDSIKTTNVQI